MEFDGNKSSRGLCQTSNRKEFMAFWLDRMAINGQTTALETLLQNVRHFSLFCFYVNEPSLPRWQWNILLKLQNCRHFSILLLLCKWALFASLIVKHSFEFENLNKSKEILKRQPFWNKVNNGQTIRVMWLDLLCGWISGTGLYSFCYWQMNFLGISSYTGHNRATIVYESLYFHKVFLPKVYLICV